MLSETTRALLIKYWKIIIAVGLFLLFDLGVMGTNWYSSYRFSESAVSINLSGRQRMLSQRMTKALLSLQEDVRQNLLEPQQDIPEKSSQDGLRSTVELSKMAMKSAGGMPILADLSTAGSLISQKHDSGETGSSIDLSDEQREALQQITKTFTFPQEGEPSDIPGGKNHAELRLVVNLFDTTLRGFRDGAMVTGGDNNPVFLTQVETIKATKIVEDAYKIWNPYLERLQPLMQGTFTEAQLAAAVKYARDNNLELLRLMNDLTTDLEYVANARALRLRIIQIIGLLAALINFSYTVFISVRDLIASDKAITKARKETDEIFATVREGLFLIGPDYRLGSQYSESLARVLLHDIQPDMDFMSILYTMVPKPVFDASKDYIDLLFTERVKEALIGDLNPLSEVAVNTIEGQADEKTRYLSFNFNRVITDGRITHILVTVQDITERVQLTRQLEEVKGRAQTEIEVLLRLLSTDQDTLQRFLANAENTLGQINERLRDNEDSQRERIHTLNYVLRTIHGLKGEAAVLGIEMFESYAHTCEKELVQIRDSDEVTGDDMVRLTVMLEGFYERLASLSNIINRMSGITISTDTEENRIHVFVENLQTLAQRISSDQGKPVDLITDIEAMNQLPRRVVRELEAITIQLLRNAISHGIETGQERQDAQKPVTGQVLITCQDLGDDQYEFMVRDDGKGIVPKQIRNVLVATGRMNREEADMLDDIQVAQQIFEPGFSSVEVADRDAGHGIGLDAVLGKVRAIHGRMHICSRAYKFTEFRIHFEL